eukprot:11165648-Lingulodinium_polyedra.AAC.1
MCWAHPPSRYRDSSGPHGRPQCPSASWRSPSQLPPPRVVCLDNRVSGTHPRTHFVEVPVDR